MSDPDPVTDLKRELLAAAERRSIGAPVPVGRRAPGLRVGAPRLVPMGAALAGAALAALFVTAQWSRSPSFLERAEAALTPPAGKILHEKWVQVDTGHNFQCTITTAGELWIDEPTQRFRARMRDPLAPNPHPPSLRDRSRYACGPFRAYELGGFVGFPNEVYQFVPPDRIVHTVVTWGAEPYDPVPHLRRAIRAGQAYDLGKATRGGRTLERIQIGDCTPSVAAGEKVHVRRLCPGGRSNGDDVYVDPETFYPVEIDRREPVGVREVTRFSAFEYLPRTAANLALTDIRAQHPYANGPRIPRSLPGWGPGSAAP